MKYLGAIIFFILWLSGQVNAQEKLHVKHQRNFKPSATYDSLRITSPDFDKIEIQIRLQILNHHSGIHKAFVLDKHKDKLWKGVSLEYYYFNGNHFDFKKIIFDTLQLGQLWEQSFATLIKNEYLNLPSQNEVQRKIYRQSDKEILLVSDGTTYEFEILTRKSKRRLVFSNPEEYYNFYSNFNGEASTYGKYLDVLNILASALDLKTYLVIKE